MEEREALWGKKNRTPTWFSAIAKESISGRVAIGTLGIEGDEQADRRHHGGRDKAVLGYAAGNYDRWREELQLPDFGPGVLGENLDIEGQFEGDVCIGDRYELGSAVLEVSQPREPCWKPAMLHGLPDLTRQMAEKGRTGWYFRVLREGFAEALTDLKLTGRPHPEWTIERANRLLYGDGDGARPEALSALAALPQLSEAWRRMLLR